ncbi:hypothetical protein ABEO75_18390 [Paenibacillus macerans]|uniref:hypothetical protein n=1 Tax=Paenibacillus macerans TaxID=44252 RepID=UPI00242BE813|nr:hypothetical protein [Paenibacillus macerans]MBS5909134.1 hypothetical protein [Paenibacillus macerans]MED4957873.1 hypothetical protein [Paenibacillus macerans]
MSFAGGKMGDLSEICWIFPMRTPNGVRFPAIYWIFPIKTARLSSDHLSYRGPSKTAISPAVFSCIRDSYSPASRRMLKASGFHASLTDTRDFIRRKMQNVKL